ncbi:MAG: hypothetical protein P1U89_12090 [Verrucomicrobiales bacterium]|nr:hypothetical protein [Verrucomicrobiales bacterium]
MKKRFPIFIGLLALVCAAFIVTGVVRATLMMEISDAGHMLVSDTGDTSDFDSKLYEIAYSSPVAPEKIGLWLEAVLSKHFETFSANEKPLSPELAGKLRGWPIAKTAEIDLSNSSATDEWLAQLGKLNAADWVDLSGTGITEKGLLTLANNAPQLRKLQLNNTKISWNAELVEALLSIPSLKDVEIDENQIDVTTREKIKSVLEKR